MCSEEVLPYDLAGQGSELVNKNMFFGKIYSISFSCSFLEGFILV